jgi:hypothetical protein
VGSKANTLADPVCKAIVESCLAEFEGVLNTACNPYIVLRRNSVWNRDQSKRILSTSTL